MIVITNPVTVANEAIIINELFNEGLTLLHVRKPNINKQEMQSFINEIKCDYHNRIVVHQHFDLATDLVMKRLHFTERTRPDFDVIVNHLAKPEDFVFSTSVHSVEDFNNLQNDFQYAFLSPVYNSISKPEYKADDILIKSIGKRTNFKTKLIALGGISTTNYKQTLLSGFDDAAFLGTLWNSENPIKEFRKCIKATDYAQ